MSQQPITSPDAPPAKTTITETNTTATTTGGQSAATTTVVSTTLPAAPPNPIRGLLMSRKFLLAVVGVAQTIAGHYLTIPADITLSINALLAIVIGAIAYEDAHQ